MSEQITVEEAIEAALAEAEQQAERDEDFDNLSLRDATNASLEALDELLGRLQEAGSLTLTLESEELAVLYGLAEGAATYLAINGMVLGELKNLANALETASR